jgi:hypothetical protein
MNLLGKSEKQEGFFSNLQWWHPLAEQLGGQD